MKNLSHLIFKELLCSAARSLLIVIFVCFTCSLFAQQKPLWHGIERTLRYQPSAEGYKGINLKRKFNRALYGTNTGFRVEAGDQPEFALYLPGMGGNLKLGFKKDGVSKWLTAADSVVAIYNPGEMLYEIYDQALAGGKINIAVLAFADEEGMVLKISAYNLKQPIEIFASYGGVSGQKFSRDGDLGADPESVFYLKEENCKDNQFNIADNQFKLSFFDANGRKELAKGKDSISLYRNLYGIFPNKAKLQVSDASLINNLNSFLNGKALAAPVLNGSFTLSNQTPAFITIQAKSTLNKPEEEFLKAKQKIQLLSSRVILNTPDAYLNHYGAALAIAADAIWEEPSYIHGSVAWRMHLNGWRGAYVADPLGWHDRAAVHFKSYALSQYTSPLTGPVVADTALNLARQKEEKGNSVFSDGYISRNPGKEYAPHHYDMNLVFIDQLLSHFFYLGDTAEIKALWPVVKRHLAWEKRNFDADDDGLYDAYAAIWASDALQYSGGAVTHSSAYNYRANLLAARIAQLLKEDDSKYVLEAQKILKAINSTLWMKDLGRYAEYKDALGNKLLHPSAALWTVYHAIDSKVPDAEQAYQLVKYVEEKIPHIPIVAKGLKGDYHTLSTTNWQPYDWSINNVASGEVLHTALAFWQSNQADKAFQLWKGSLLEYMFMGASPGNFGQISFYDAIRGELYRDFADPIGMAARTLTEGLFGIQPDAINDTLTIKPGFPQDWAFANLSLPDISIDFKQDHQVSTYQIKQHYSHLQNLKLQLVARSSKVKSIKVNGVSVPFQVLENAVDHPMIEINVSAQAAYKVVIDWVGEAIQTKVLKTELSNAKGTVDLTGFEVNGVQGKANTQLNKDYLSAEGVYFIKVKQGDMIWKEPVHYTTPSIFEFSVKNGVFTINSKANTAEIFLYLNGKKERALNLQALKPVVITLNTADLVTGTNEVELLDAKGNILTNYQWNEDRISTPLKLQPVDLNSYFNASVVDIFKNQYLSPRPQTPTLQLPIQGIGNWCYPLVAANIDDSGFRKSLVKDTFISPLGITYQSSSTGKNILYTSKWDNYPDSLSIPLNGKSNHAYFVLAGSTNPMQSRLVNGALKVNYQDGTEDILELKNPENWWPIEQDYYTDGFAFTTDAPKPYRLYLKSGNITKDFKNFTSIKGFTSYAVDGGAATLLDMPLNPNKELKNIQLITYANDVVIGLMSITLSR